MHDLSTREAYIAISEVKARYWRTLDTKDWAGFRLSFNGYRDQPLTGQQRPPQMGPLRRATMPPRTAGTIEGGPPQRRPADRHHPRCPACSIGPVESVEAVGSAARWLSGRGTARTLFNEVT